MNSSLPKPTDFIEVVANAGDTFDILALDHYNDELLASLIIFHNPEIANIIVFEAPTPVAIPVINQQEAGVLPPWRS